MKKSDQILVRVSKYGKWKPLDVPNGIEKKSDLEKFCIKEIESDFIQIRLNGVESIIKNK